MTDVIAFLGGPAAVARLVGCKPPSVIEWRQRGVPPSRCAALEVATKGAYPVEVVRPDIPWRRMADPGWPWHPDGRPMFDAADAHGGCHAA